MSDDLLDEPGMRARLRTALAEELALLPEFVSYPAGLYTHGDRALRALLVADDLLEAMLFWVEHWLKMARIARDLAKEAGFDG